MLPSGFQPGVVHAATVPLRLQRVVELCAERNTVLEFETSFCGNDKSLLMFHVCRLSIEHAAFRMRKACVLAWTVPLVRQHFHTMSALPGLQTRHVLGDLFVDSDYTSALL